MPEINLLEKLPRGKKSNVNARAAAKNDEVIRISREYGFALFRRAARVRLRRLSLRRALGAGRRGHGRALRPEARRPRARRRLRQGVPGQGLHEGCPGLEAFGLDISRYALMNCEPEVDRPPASGQRHRAAVPRQQLQGRRLPQHRSTISTATELHRRAEGDAARLRRARLRAGRFLPHARAEGRCSWTGC